MYDFARDDPIDLDELLVRLRKMSDEDLIRFGKAARSKKWNAIVSADLQFEHESHGLYWLQHAKLRCKRRRHERFSQQLRVGCDWAADPN